MGNKNTHLEKCHQTTDIISKSTQSNNCIIDIEGCQHPQGIHPPQWTPSHESLDTVTVSLYFVNKNGQSDLRVPMTFYLTGLLQYVKRVFDLGEDSICLWTYCQRKNGNVRIDERLTDSKWTALKHDTDKRISFFVEEVKFSNNAVPIHSMQNFSLSKNQTWCAATPIKMNMQPGKNLKLVFVKYYDVDQKKQYPLGCMYVSCSDQMQFVKHRCAEMVPGQSKESLFLYEEACDRIVMPLEGIYKTVLDNDIGTGDILVVSNRSLDFDIGGGHWLENDVTLI